MVLHEAGNWQISVCDEIAYGVNLSPEREDTAFEITCNIKF